MTDFYEEDEPVEKITATFDSGEKAITVSPCGILNCPDPQHRKERAAYSAEMNALFAKLVEEGKIIAADPNKTPVQWKDIKGL